MTYEACDLCPRMCGADRKATIDDPDFSSPDLDGSVPAGSDLTLRRETPSLRPSLGYCSCSSTVRAARAALHMWEEPCISGVNGSGAVFFSGCSLRCCFCQNRQISSPAAGSQGRGGSLPFGKDMTVRKLADVFLRLQDQGAHNINLVTATQYLPSIIKALDMVKSRLSIPVVYNCSGYERTESIDALDGYIDVYLPDLKYFDPAISSSYSKAPDYFSAASKAVAAMALQVGKPVMEEYSGEKGRCLLMKRGLIIRHMVLPGHKEDSIKILDWIKGNLPQNGYYISLMSQYTPYVYNSQFPELNRRVTTYEYNKVLDYALEIGLTEGYMQKRTSAKEEYTPPFDLEGLVSLE